MGVNDTIGDMTSATTRIEVDLSSDTVTRPTPAMRRFMCDAEVEDEPKARRADPKIRASVSEPR